MNIPEGQRLILAWLDTAVELQQILDRNPGIRRIYLITTDSALPAPMRSPYAKEGRNYS